MMFVLVLLSSASHGNGLANSDVSQWMKVVISSKFVSLAGNGIAIMMFALA
jgi:hypothetical protein